MEVELGSITQDNASSSCARAFESMIVKKHTEANNNLKRMASSLSITLPDSASKEGWKKINELKRKKGKDFDKAYVHMMVDDHKKDIAEFRKYADSYSDPTIKNIASTTLPVGKNTRIPFSRLPR